MPRWFQGPRCTNLVRLDGQVAVITGANTGIGKETARELSRRGAQVVIACRDIEKAEDAAREISSETKNAVTTVKLDLASLNSIRMAAQSLKIQQPKIHLLINNAGIMVCPQWKTEDDFEMQLGVNHLGHFLWTLMLLDNVKEAAPSRIINVSSIAHTRGRMDFDDIMMEKNYEPTRAYCRSKLANILFTKELADRLRGVYKTSTKP
uniref:Putative Retinol dehydrogenase n=1 Tax=Daphnia magna TaxID=35525 RepID=A0A0N8BA79_9CRUS